MCNAQYYGSRIPYVIIINEVYRGPPTPIPIQGQHSRYEEIRSEQPHPIRCQRSNGGLALARYSILSYALDPTIPLASIASIIARASAFIHAPRTVQAPSAFYCVLSGNITLSTLFTYTHPPLSPLLARGLPSLSLIHYLIQYSVCHGPILAPPTAGPAFQPVYESLRLVPNKHLTTFAPTCTFRVSARATVTVRHHEQRFAKSAADTAAVDFFRRFTNTHNQQRLVVSPRLAIRSAASQRPQP